MNAKMIRCALAALMLLGAPAMATVYTWTGGNGDWDDYTKWSCAPSCDPTSYPSTTDDDVVINSAVTIVLTTETIDDLSIGNPGSNGGPTFTGDGSVATLTCDTVSISGGASHYTLVTLQGKGVIETN